MKNVALVGSGIAALTAAHAFRKAGHAVTLYSDRSAESWLQEGRPTGTAARFELALAFERSLGLNHWDDVAPPGEGVHVTYSPDVGNRLVTLTGRLTYPFRAVDVRLQSQRWMTELEARGGRVIIGTVDVERLDAIAAEHDLTLVAAGKGDLTRLFPRHEERSVYDKPQRHLAMVITQGGRMAFDGVPFLPVKFNFFGTAGETFWVPYYHPTAGPSWCLVFEARPGGAMDRFEGLDSGEAVLARALEVVKDIIPWDHAWLSTQRLADRNGWLVGKVTPAVRSPVGRLPSGRIVGCLGDTAMTLDPIGGQGANNGIKMAQNFIECAVAHGDRPFDAAFLEATFERHWEAHGRAIYTFNNVLLEPLTAAGKHLLIAQYGSTGEGPAAQQAIANAFIDNFNDPRSITTSFLDVATARRTLRRLTGRPWWWSLASGLLGVAWNQLLQAVGLTPRHPMAETAWP
jgi:2-polyprenyl-6-methoxyphenol hydroxylase-like FAD-dependent oxidoreductase